MFPFHYHGLLLLLLYVSLHFSAQKCPKRAVNHTPNNNNNNNRNCLTTSVLCWTWFICLTNNCANKISGCFPYCASVHLQFRFIFMPLLQFRSFLSLLSFLLFVLDLRIRYFGRVSNTPGKVTKFSSQELQQNFQAYRGVSLQLSRGLGDL